MMAVCERSNLSGTETGLFSFLAFVAANPGKSLPNETCARPVTRNLAKVFLPVHASDSVRFRWY